MVNIFNAPRDDKHREMDMDLFKELTLEDKAVFDGYLASFNTQASELSFTNLYMWRRKYHFKYAVFGRFLWILNVSDSGKWYFSPPIGDYTGDVKASIDVLQDYLRSQNRPLIIKKAERSIMTAIRTLYPDQITVTEMRDDFDYLYDYQGLQTLKGNLYHKKRNHVNKFLKTYPNWSYEALEDDNTEEVKVCLDRWCSHHNCAGNPDLSHERMAIEDALDHRIILGFNGGLLRINGTVEAFTLAEQLNPDTTVIHIEKADLAMDGLYAAINQLYLENCPSPTTLVNREQDMGLEGLRRAKESYQPVGFVEKYTLLFDNK